MVEPPDQVVFFLDRCLGTVGVPLALRGAGAAVELHADYFDPDCLDVDWIPDVAARGWVILTKDQRIRHRPHEWMAFTRADAAAFALSAGQVRGEAVAGAFVVALPRMLRILATHNRPLWATVTRLGEIAVKEGERRRPIKR